MKIKIFNECGYTTAFKDDYYVDEEKQVEHAAVLDDNGIVIQEAYTETIIESVLVKGDYTLVDEVDLAQIGLTKKFDVVNGAVVDMTPQEITDAASNRNAAHERMQKAGQISALKQQLSAMDYKTSKYADGEYTQQEWAAIVMDRKAIRQQIRQLEQQGGTV